MGQAIALNVRLTKHGNHCYWNAQSQSSVRPYISTLNQAGKWLLRELTLPNVKSRDVTVSHDMTWHCDVSSRDLTSSKLFPRKFSEPIDVTFRSANGSYRHLTAWRHNISQLDLAGKFRVMSNYEISISPLNISEKSINYHSKSAAIYQLHELPETGARTWKHQPCKRKKKVTGA